MAHSLNGFRGFRSVGAGIMLSLGLAACASSGHPGVVLSAAGGADSAALPWPPREDSIVSPDAWTEMELKGIDYSEIDGAYEIAADRIRLKDGDGLAWALYSIPAGPASQPLSVILNYGLEPRAGGDNCDAWLALANYAQGRWELRKADAEPYICALADAKSYVSPGGYCHAAVVFDGEGKVRVDRLLFERYENPPDSPPGFRLSIESGVVGLAWDASAGADGYRLYKSADSDFSNATLLTETQGLEYTDSAVAPEERWFYWVVADMGSTSLPSGPVYAVLPQIDLPMPKDFWSPGSDGDGFELAWDWEGPNPDGFTILMAADKPNFDPAVQSVKTYYVSGSTRSHSVGSPDVNSLHVWYCQIAAFEMQGVSRSMGQWTKALPCVNKNNTAWAFPETLGPGRAPVRAARTGDGLAAAWFDAGTVMCGQRDSGGNWTIADTGLSPLLETYPGQLLPHRGFDQFLDIAWHDGVCLVCAHSADTGDLWAAVGNPGGGWTQELALGDRDPLGGTDSGVNLDCAAGPGSAGSGEYSVSCAVFSRDGYGFPETYLASRPASGGAEDWLSFGLSAEALQLDSCDYPTCEYGQDDGLLRLCLFADAYGQDGNITETLKLGRFDCSAEAPAPEWDLVRSDGTDWGGPFPYISSCFPSQVQLTHIAAPRPGSSDGPLKFWKTVGYSERDLDMGSFQWISQWQSPPQASSGPYSLAAFAGESAGWYPRCSQAIVGGYPGTSRTLAWNESRGENYLRQEDFGNFIPSYCPFSLPGSPGPQADIICVDDLRLCFLYADRADGQIKCSAGSDLL